MFSNKLAIKEERAISEEYTYLERLIVKGKIVKEYQKTYLVELFINDINTTKVLGHCDKSLLFRSDTETIPSNELHFLITTVKTEEHDGAYRLSIKLTRRSSLFILQFIKQTVNDSTLKLKAIYRANGIYKIRTSRKIPKSTLEILYKEFKDEKFIFKLDQKTVGINNG